MDKVKFGEQLAEVMTRLRLTQSEVARNLHVQPNTVNKWVKGVNMMRAEQLRSFCEKFKPSEEDVRALYSLTDYPYTPGIPQISVPTAITDNVNKITQTAISEGSLDKHPFNVRYPPYPDMVGRDKLLEEIDSILAKKQVIALTGIGGVGKTLVAAEFAHRYRAHYPGGVFWLDVESPTAVASQVASYAGPSGLTLSGWADMSPDDQVQAVLAAWRAPVVRLLIFDNLQDPKVLREWRPRGGGSRILITTQRVRWSTHSGVVALPVRPLNDQNSLTLLLLPRATQKEQTVDHILQNLDEAQAANSISTDLGGLPLALALAGSYLERYPHESLRDYAIRLHANLLRDSSLTTGPEEGLPTEHNPNVAATFQITYDRLVIDSTNVDSEPHRLARTILHRAAWCAPLPIPDRLMLLAASGDPNRPEDVTRLSDAFNVLLGLGLLEWWQHGNFSLHRLVAYFARTRAIDTEADIAAIEEALISEINRVMQFGLSEVGAQYLEHVRLFVERLGPRTDKRAVQLVTMLGELERDRGQRAKAREFFSRAINIIESYSSPDAVTLIHLLRDIASLDKDLGNSIEAGKHLERAQEIGERRLGINHAETIAVIIERGYLAKDMRDGEEAHELFTLALERAEQGLGHNHQQTAVALLALGLLDKDYGRFTTARTLLEEATRVNHMVLGDNHPQTIDHLSALAFFEKASGQNEAAQALFTRAARLAELVFGPTHPKTAEYYMYLGYLAKEQRDYTQAHSYMTCAAVIMRDARGPEHPETARCQAHLAWIDYDQGKFGDAAAIFTQVLAILERSLGEENKEVQEVRRWIARCINRTSRH